MKWLDGRVVVVTGAARGIGAELARLAVADGARVALLGHEPELLESLADRLGPRAGAWPVDVTDAAGLAGVAGQVRDRFGAVDAVVANAGIATGGLFALADAAAYERTIEVNLLGSIRTARAFLPALVDSRGYLLQVASMAALLPVPGLSAYCAAKSGAETFAHCLRAEVAHRGVDVGVGYLGWVDTDMTRGADRVASFRQLRARLPGPLGRTYPVEAAAEALLAGVRRRSAHVYCPSWLRWAQPLRWLGPAAVAVDGRRRSAQVEVLQQRDGAAATRALGAGGEADRQSRRGRVGQTSVPPTSGDS